MSAFLASKLTGTCMESELAMQSLLIMSDESKFEHHGRIMQNSCSKALGHNI